MLGSHAYLTNETGTHLIMGWFVAQKPHRGFFFFLMLQFNSLALEMHLQGVSPVERR